MSSPSKGSSGNASISSGPINGSFPVDRLHECASYIQIYSECLARNNNYAPMCKKETRDYLLCRKEKGLMTSRDFRDADIVEDWIISKSGSTPSSSSSNATSKSFQSNSDSEAHKHQRGYSRDGMKDFEDWRRKKDINSKINPNASM